MIIICFLLIETMVLLSHIEYTESLRIYHKVLYTHVVGVDILFFLDMYVHLIFP